MGEVKNVFVSYPPRYSKLADNVVSELATHGLKPSSTKIVTSLLPTTGDKPAPGVQERREVERAVQSADAVIVIVGPKGELDKQQQFEWRAALEAEWENSEKRLIPVLLQNAELPSFLSSKQGLRVRDPRRDWDRAVKALICLLKDEEPQARDLITVEEEDPAKRRERLQYIERAAQAMKIQES